MKILETQSAILTNAEVLVHIRNVHQQSLRNHEYSNRKGAKLRPLKTVIEEVHRNFTDFDLTQTPLPPDTHNQSRTTHPYPRLPDQPPAPPKPSALQPHGDERIPLEATLDAKPADAVALPPIPAGPRVMRYDATEALLAARAGGGAAAPFWDPNPTVYAAALAPGEADDGAVVAFLPEVLEVLEGAATGRARLTRGERVMICNLRPWQVAELDYVVEEAEERLGGKEGVRRLVGRLREIWVKYGWEQPKRVEGDEDEDVDMEG